MNFDFGKNWQRFSSQALTQKHIEQAQDDFEKLFAGIPLNHQSFLDIGFGQGLTSLLAATQGSQVMAIDINPKCFVALEQTKLFFKEVSSVKTRTGSILDQEFLKTLPAFDIVHAWGVLHHTGNMKQAIANAAGLVKKNGFLVISIYNKQITSPLWKIIKATYNKLPSAFQRIFIGIFYPIIFCAKFLVTGKNPKKMDRGMDFYFNVVDWVGGTPYEYATQNEIISKLKSLGFCCLKTIPPKVPTGCNEFIFQNIIEN